MRKNRILSVLSATALLLAGASCSNDPLDLGAQDGQSSENGDPGVYLAVTFDLPSARESRSFTDGDNSSNSGTEIGQEYENTVKSAYVVLARTDNSFIAAGQSVTLDNVGVSGRSYRTTAKFTKTELSQFYQKITDADRETGTNNYLVNVFVFANPTEGLSDLLENAKFGDKNWVNGIGVYKEGDGNNQGEIWLKDYFLMSNSSISTRRFPSEMAKWDNFSTEANAFNLCGMNNFGRPDEIDNLTAGNVYVERAAARYDFRDGALDGVPSEGKDENFNGFKAQTYHVVLDKDEKPLVDVMLGKMSMVNMNQEYYFLRRVSNNGLPSGEGFKIAGPELPWYTNATGTLIGTDGNYIVDAFADWKSKTPKAGFSNYFNYPFFNDEGVMDNAETGSDGWYTSLISTVLNGEKDNHEGGTWDEGKNKPDYRIWRYLTEGVIPGVEEQQNGISNGIVFKGQMLPAREKDAANDDQFTQLLLDALKITPTGDKLHDPILFSFGGHIYCTWEHIKRMAIYLSLTSLKYEDSKWQFTINRSTTIYNAVFGTGGFGSVSFICDDKTDELKNADFLKPGVETLTDTMTDVDDASANAKWDAWKKAFPNSDDNADEGEEMAYFAAFRDAAVGKNIALFQTSYDKNLGGWGYYCYYYYWNRHNDNGQVGDMGPMEFAVVRNNVYKLAVTKIARLGHPRIAANDPDKPTPNTPDEKGDVYISVTCTTLPWVVRENTIEF